MDDMKFQDIIIFYKKNHEGAKKKSDPHNYQFLALYRSQNKISHSKLHYKKEVISVVRHHHTLAAASTDPNLERTISVEPTLTTSSDDDREGNEIL